MTVRQRVFEQFRQLCRDVAQAEDEGDGNATDAYDALRRFLEEQQGADTAMLKAEMVAIVRQFRHARARGTVDLSAEAIAYCMHSLRWPEVREVADFEQNDFFSPRCAAVLTPILNAYNDD